MPTEGLTVTFTNEAAQRVRYRFEPRSAGGWTRHKEHFDDGVWRPVGTEIVADADIELDVDSDLVAVVH